jgi:hypothetical protein
MNKRKNALSMDSVYQNAKEEKFVTSFEGISLESKLRNFEANAVLENDGTFAKGFLWGLLFSSILWGMIIFVFIAL